MKNLLARILPRLDRYIISKFIGTYIYSIVLIISIAIVFDVKNMTAMNTKRGEKRLAK